MSPATKTANHDELEPQVWHAWHCRDLKLVGRQPHAGPPMLLFA